MKISCNLTKKDVQYLVSWDSSKKNVPYFPFSDPYVTIFINNCLHLLLNRCDVKLKPVLIDCSVFTSLGSFFMHLSEHFFVVVVVIFPWLLTLSPLKKWRKLLFRDCYQVNLKILLHTLSSNEWYREPTLAREVYCPKNVRVS